MSDRIRVLYVNQSGRASGAERSLVELLAALPDRVDPILACPPGELTAMTRELGIPVEPIAETDLSFRPHPVHTTRGLAWIGRAAADVRSLVRRHRIDLVHANTTRAGLAAVAARALGVSAPVVHIRDWVPAGRGPAALLAGLERGAAAVIANSRFTAGQLPSAGRTPIVVVPNPVDVRRFHAGVAERRGARSALRLPADAPVLAVVGQITPWKGQDDAISALAAVEFDTAPLLTVVGSAKFDTSGTRYDNAAFERSLRDLAATKGVADRVRFLGERADVPTVLAAADILLVPSWREAFGRVAVEGMAMGLPVIGTNVGGPAEIVRDGVDGLLVEPRRPDLWAEAITGLLAQPELRERMGASGRERAVAEFRADAHAARVVEVYERVLASR